MESKPWVILRYYMERRGKGDFKTPRNCWQLGRTPKAFLGAPVLGDLAYRQRVAEGYEGNVVYHPRT